MGKYNAKGYDVSKTTNMAGGTSYKRSDLRQEIASVVLNSMLNGDLYYQKETERVNQILDLINQASKHKDDIDFLAKSMVYTRNVANLRSVTHLMAVGMVEAINGDPIIRRALRKSLVRPDDLTEILSLWNTRHTESDGKAKMLPNCVRRAFKDVLETKFDEYQIKKYAADNSKVKLKDVVKIAHPSSKCEMFKKLIEGDLAQAETMNTKLSSGESAKEAFSDLLRNRKMGYMQAIKHICNALRDGVDKDTLKLWADFVTNDKAVANSRLLPFRYYDAWKEVKKLKMDEFDKEFVKQTLETAFAKSAMNTGLVESNERICIILDESGSMSGDPFQYGKILAASTLLALGDSQVVFYTFAEKARRINISAVKKSPFDWIEDLDANGGGTYFSAPLEELIKTGTKADKLIIFTDMQLYEADNTWRNTYNKGNFTKFYTDYRKISPNVKTLFWNLRGYANGTPLKLADSVLEVAGYSDSMLNVVSKIWDNPLALIEEIEAITL
ncbi:MAG: TROVE domain-containing protein [Candidatus Pacebacteria bacterium]|nr:TROVE domain-containing protein [Candidatus Paceibacterota bacterium]